MGISKFAHKEYKRYCLTEGSQHIVSEFALHHILKLITKYSVKEVLEVGVGIGTISGSIIKYAKKEGLPIAVTGTEANSFCLTQIPDNLGNDYQELRLFKNVKNLPEDDRYDFIIIDGAEENLSQIEKKLKHRGIVVIEGDRADQVKTVRKIFPKAKFAQILSLKPNGEYSVKNSNDYQGGLKVIFTEPDLKQHIHWIKLKIQAKLKFQKRRYNK